MKSALRTDRCYDADPSMALLWKESMPMYSAALPNYLKMPNNSRPYI